MSRLWLPHCSVVFLSKEMAIIMWEVIRNAERRSQGSIDASESCTTRRSISKRKFHLDAKQLSEMSIAILNKKDAVQELASARLPAAHLVVGGWWRDAHARPRATVTRRVPK